MQMFSCCCSACPCDCEDRDIKTMDANGSEGNSERDALTFTTSLKSLNKTLSPIPGQHPENECYNMSHANRGIALIFNHKYFDNPIMYKVRKGTEFDRDAMHDAFKSLGFHVQVYEDLSREEIINALTVVTKMDHTNNDCLAVAVMSHGSTYGRIHARDKDYTANELVEFFSGENCPSLAGKPKLFFIQACRGEKTDSGVKIQSDSVENKNEIVYTIPTMADILIMFATAEGYYAWRDTQSGGCFIQSLARRLTKHHKERDLISILTLVNREVAIGFESRTLDPDFNKKKAMCCIVSMLTRTLYFQ